MTCKFWLLPQRFFHGPIKLPIFIVFLQDLSKVILGPLRPNFKVSNLTTCMSIICPHFPNFRIFLGQVPDIRVDKILTLTMLLHVVFCYRLQVVSDF